LFYGEERYTSERLVHHPFRIRSNAGCCSALLPMRPPPEQRCFLDVRGPKSRAASPWTETACTRLCSARARSACSSYHGVRVSRGNQQDNDKQDAGQFAIPSRG